MPKIIKLAGNVWNVEMKGLLVIGKARPGTGVTIPGISEPFPDKANDGTLTKINKMTKIKKKLTAAQKRARKIAKAEKQKKYTWVFMNGKQVKVKRLPTIEGISIDEYIRQNADPIWLHQNEMWEFMQTDEDEELS
jgi:16S rRNA U516 pseudouridylate synthase RsuA-like enzyme